MADMDEIRVDSKRLESFEKALVQLRVFVAPSQESLDLQALLQTFGKVKCSFPISFFVHLFFSFTNFFIFSLSFSIFLFSNTQMLINSFSVLDDDLNNAGTALYLGFFIHFHHSLPFHHFHHSLPSHHFHHSFIFHHFHHSFIFHHFHPPFLSHSFSFFISTDHLF